MFDFGRRRRRRRVRPVHVPVGTIGLVVAKHGAVRPPGNPLAAFVECDSFQDSHWFLTGGGQQGRQQQVLTSGSYAIDADLFEVITVNTPEAIARNGLSSADLHEVTIPAGETGVVLTHIGAVPEPPLLPIPLVPGHDHFQRPWIFLENGGRRGVQAETLPEGGTYAINPWFARVIRVPIRVLIAKWGGESALDAIELHLQGHAISVDVRVVYQIPAGAAPILVSRMAEYTAAERFVEQKLEATIRESLRSAPSLYTINEFVTEPDRVNHELAISVRETLNSLGIREFAIVFDALHAEDADIDELARLKEFNRQHGSETIRAFPGTSDGIDDDPISTGRGGTALLTDTAEVTIYLSDAGPHERVEHAVEEFLVRAGAVVVDRDDPVLGSWFRRIRAKLSGAARSPIAREAMSSAVHAMETRFVHAQDAAVTKDLMSNLGPLIKSLEDVNEAVVRVGALLTVKIDGRLIVCQLTAKQMLELEHKPSLATSPHEILSALELGVNGSPRPIAELVQPAREEGDDVPDEIGDAH